MHYLTTDPNDRTATFALTWTPSEPGEYTVQALAVGGEGATSAPDSARMLVGAQVGGATPTPVATAVPNLVIPGG